MQHALYVLTVPCLLTAINIALIYRMIRKLETQQLSKILKGGAL